MSPTVEAIHSDSPQSTTKAIEPYINGLRAWREAVGRDPDGLPEAPLMIAGRQFELTADLWQEIDTYLDTPGEVRQGDMAWLLTYGVALSVKSLTDIEVPATADAETGFVDRAQLMLNASMGRTLVRKTQQEIDRSLARGDPRRARSLGSFQRQLRQVHLEVRAALTDLEGPLRELPEHGTDQESPAREGKSTLSDIVSGPDGVAAPTRKARVPDARVKRARDTRNAESPGTPDRALLLLVLLAGALIARFVLFPHALPFVETVDPASGVAAPHEAVLGVRVSPPALFVTVDPVRWSEADLAKRESWIGQIVDRLRGPDRSSAHFMLPDGSPVGRWSVQGGIEILEPESIGLE